MRKKFVTLLIASLLLVLTFGTASATPASDLAATARYASTDSTFYFAIRADEDYVNTLNDLIDRINNNTAGALIPPGTEFDVTELLEAVAFELFAADFTTEVRPWMGDTIGFVIPSLEPAFAEEPITPFVAVFEVSDYDTAENFIMSTFGGLAPTETDPLLFDLGDAGLLLADDALLIGTSAAIVQDAYNTASPLSDDADFNTATDALPLPGYNALVYFNLARLVDDIIAGMDATAPGMAGDPTDFMPDVDTGISVSGFSLQGERDLIIDVVTIDDADFQAELFAQYDLTLPDPLDPTFARFIPADAQLVIHETNFANAYNAFWAGFDLSASSFDAQIDMMLNDPFLGGQMTPEEREFLESFNIDAISFSGMGRTLLIQFFAGFTGLNIEDDFVNWMTGDYAMYLRLIPTSAMGTIFPGPATSSAPLTADNPDFNFMPDGAFIAQITDSDAAANVIAGFARAADLYGVNYRLEDINGGEQIVFTAPLRLLLGSSRFDLNPSTPELDIIVGYNEDIFTIGTRPAASFALAPNGANLLDSDGFQTVAENLLLPDAITVWYVGGGAIVEALGNLESVLSESDMEVARFLFSQIETATISAQIVDDGVSRSRLTLTLPEEVTLEIPAALTAPTGRDVVVIEPTAMPTIEPAPGINPEPITLNSIYATIPQSTTADGMPVLGDPSAPVEVVYYGSFSCPFCMDFHENTWSTLIDRVRAGDARLIYVPMSTGGVPGAEPANLAALCASEQGAFWEYQDRLYDRAAFYDDTGYSDARLLAQSAAIRLDQDAFLTCLRQLETVPTLLTAADIARENGISGTPSLTFNGVFDIDATSPAGLNAAIDAALGN